MTVSEQERITTLHKLGVLDSPPDMQIDRLVGFVMQSLDMPIGLVTLLDETRQWFKSAQGLDGVTQTSRAVAFCDTTIKNSSVFVVEDASTDPQFKDNPLVTGELGLNFYAGAPLIVDGSAAIGALCVLDRVHRNLDEADLQVLATCSEIVVSLLQESQPTDELVVYLDAVTQQVVYNNSLAAAVFAPIRGILVGQSFGSIFGFDMPVLSEEQLLLVDSGIPSAHSDGWSKLSLLRLGPTVIKVSAVKLSGVATEPKVSKSEQTRAEILEAAKLVLVEAGEVGFTMRRVAKQAKVSLSNLQYYFSSKDELVKAMIESIGMSYWQYYERRLAPVTNPVDRFIGAAEFVLNDGPDENMVRLLREFWSMASRDETIGAYVSRFYSGCRMVASSLIKEMNPALSNETAEMMGAQAVSLITGAFVYTEAFAGAEPLSGFRAHVIQQLYALIRSQGDLGR